MKRYADLDLINSKDNDGFNATVKSYYKIVADAEPLKIYAKIDYIDNAAFQVIMDTSASTASYLLTIYASQQVSTEADPELDYDGGPIYWHAIAGINPSEMTAYTDIYGAIYNLTGLQFKSLKAELTVDGAAGDVEVYKFTYSGKSV